MPPSTYTQWTLEGQNGIESLVCGQAEFPKEIGDNEVLVKLHAASLNYKELMKTTGEKSVIEQLGVVQGSDGAGITLSVGKSVSSFAPGDKVVVHMVPNVAPDAFLTLAEISTGYGHALDGTIREYGVFHESALVHMPKNLSFEQASTLTCSGLTAWNALFGGGRGPKKGDTVLTQGTGGVSVAALQFAIASGATVISTTSSETKAERLLALGSSHVINYRTDPQWGTTAKALSTNGFGISNVIDVGGTATLAESMKAVCRNGTVTVAGVLGDVNVELPSIMDCMWRLCSVRGIFLGTKNQFKDMVKFIEEKGMEPVVDKRVFELHEVKEAYQYLKEQKHFSKVIIKIA